MFINTKVLFVSVIRSTVEMVWWIRWNWASRWWAELPRFHCLNLLHNCRRESLSQIDAREVCYGFDRLWLAVFHSCPPGGFLVRRSRGGWLHLHRELLFRGKIKENLLIGTQSSEPERGSNFVINQGGRITTVTACIYWHFTDCCESDGW